MGISIRFELVYGILIEQNSIEQDVIDEIENLLYKDKKNVLELKSCGDSYQTPELVLAFRDRGWSGPDLRYELPEGNQVKKIGSRPLPNKTEIEETRQFLESYDIPWQEPDWFAAINIT
jgi:hypothetical protein